MDFDDVINKRYSVRGYLDKEVEDEKLEYVLKAATIAPTGVNNQPFKVFVIDTKKNKKQLSEIYGAEWFVEAPYVLCVVANVDEAWTRPWDGKNIADIDATIVMDHIILAATNVGLGTCYIAAFQADKASEFLNLNDNEVPVLFTPLGYGNAEPRDTPRKEIDEFVEYIQIIMKLFILKADNSKEMNKISEDLSQNKFKITQQEKHYILMKKKRYGNYAAHMFFLFVGLFIFMPLLIANVVYLAYSLLWTSPNVLITTETKAESGESLEFNTIDEVLEKANAMF